jgi:hypothetical protein
MAPKNYTALLWTAVTPLAPNERETLSQLLDRCRLVTNEIAVGALDYSALNETESQELWDLVTEGKGLERPQTIITLGAVYRLPS